MDPENFKNLRARLGKTQKELAQLLGISIKAIHSYEQGWRKIPHHVERQLLFLVSRALNPDKDGKKCWDINQCPESRLNKCPAWEFKAGDLCWFINGTNCNGQAYTSWADKMEECRICPVFAQFFKNEEGTPHHG
ncbi:MAG: helix-turn-helix domain-containing protein [Desulfotignum sp.]|nr:helix-turn-helix domain-containing protein [Desulfotignum sp.]MCF8113604.1 helix-turn-helix domain-containing protein [Desulfotignum sp.]